MLSHLSIRNLAIIDALEVELAGGLDVVTGETGAGKSILVDALGLVLGERARPEIVRSGEDACEVEALFDVRADAKVRAALDASGLPVADELIVRRVVQASGRARAFVNGRLVTLAQLAEITSGLADISSQHEHHSLADPASHLDFLDAYAGVADARAEMADAYQAFADAAHALESGSLDERTRAEREDLLRFQIREIDEVCPRAGEEEELAELRNRLAHAEKLRGAASGAEERLYAGDGVLCEQLGAIGAELASAARLDPLLRPFADQVDAARASLEETSRELGAYVRKLPAEPERLAEVEDRLHALHRLKRKYGPDLGSVVARRARAAEELASLEHHEERLTALELAAAKALQLAANRARDLSRRRHEAARKLGDAIGAELRSLGMGGARVLVDVAPIEPGDPPGRMAIDGARLTARGIDRAELLIAPNKGEEPRPLRKIASGGELSRALLAIKRVLGDLGPAGVYVFDEVDSGVGGAVAEVIGRKLAEVSRHRQVLCITHLPQIAVHAGAHFHVSKREQKGRTVSAIRRLAEDERVEEIARMLGGARVTDKTRAAAAEMLRQAREDG